MNLEGSLLVLTRAQLYERVWSTPTLRLAREFGISDVAVAKLCRRRNIPRPPRGYWARLAAGQRPPRPELPRAHTGREERVAVLRPVSNIPGISLPAPDAHLHPLVVRLQRRLLLYKRDHLGLVRINEYGLPRFAVSPAQAERAVGALQALLAWAIACGFTLAFVGNGGTPVLCRGGHRDEVWVQEELLTTVESRGSRPRRPTGKLRFFLHRATSRTKSTRSWVESDELTLELVLGRIAATLAAPNRRSGLDLSNGHFQHADRTSDPTPLKVA